MKKRIALIALPALMVLSACVGINASPKANLMTEDNLAHEEIFGAAVEAGELGLKKGSPNKLAFDSDFVKIGYQVNYDDKQDANDSNDTISIRFVAAIKNINVKAYWHRAIAQPNGWEGANVEGERWKYKLSDDVEALDIQSKKVYSSLTDGSHTLTANSGDFVGYNGFVIYTLKDIPYATYLNSYLGAFVELRDAENESNKIFSDFFAVKIGTSDPYTSENAFAINVTEYNDKHFLQGKINGSANNITYLQDETTLDDGNNYASYKDVTLKTGDSFGSFYFAYNNEGKHFIFCGHDDFFGESASIFDESDVLDNYNTPKANGVYTLFISKGTGEENHVFTEQDAADHAFSLNTLPNWLNNDGAKIFANIERSNHSWIWVAVNFSRAEGDGGNWDSTGSFTAPSNILTIQLVRCHSSTTTPSWDATGDVAGRIYDYSDAQSVSGGVYSYRFYNFSSH